MQNSTDTKRMRWGGEGSPDSGQPFCDSVNEPDADAVPHYEGTVTNNSYIVCDTSGIVDPLLATDWKRGGGGRSSSFRRPLPYQTVTGPLMANSHPGSYCGQDAYTGMLIVEEIHGTYFNSK